MKCCCENYWNFCIWKLLSCMPKGSQSFARKIKERIPKENKQTNNSTITNESDWNRACAVENRVPILIYKIQIHSVLWFLVIVAAFSKWYWHSKQNDLKCSVLVHSITTCVIHFILYLKTKSFLLCVCVVYFHSTPLDRLPLCLKAAWQSIYHLKMLTIQRSTNISISET